MRKKISMNKEKQKISNIHNSKVLIKFCFINGFNFCIFVIFVMKTSPLWYFLFKRSVSQFMKSDTLIIATVFGHEAVDFILAVSILAKERLRPKGSKNNSLHKNIWGKYFHYKINSRRDILYKIIFKICQLH